MSEYYFPGDSDLRESVAASGSRTFRFGSRIVQRLALVDVDAQHNVLTAAQITSGIVVHTSATGAGTCSIDSAANIIAGTPALATTNDTVEVFYINDGNQTVTLAAGTGITIVTASQTLATNESALLLFQRTSATAVSVYVLGA